MRLHVLVLFLLFLPGGARRSIRIVDSHDGAQQQNNTLADYLEVSTQAQEALIPRGFATGVLRRASLRAGALPEGAKQAGRQSGHLESHRAATWLRFGPRRAEVTLQAAAAPEEDQLPSKKGFSRRAVLVAPLLFAVPAPSHAAASEAALLDELKAVRTALEPLPALLNEEKWDAVRSVLKTPPVANLWNLGESKNTLRKLAELRDDVELFELSDDVAGALQLADQFTYDNNFIYFQPGSGKVKIKEPTDQIKIASKKLGDLLGAG